MAKKKKAGSEDLQILVTLFKVWNEREERKLELEMARLKLDEANDQRAADFKLWQKGIIKELKPFFEHLGPKPMPLLSSASPEEFAKRPAFAIGNVHTDERGTITNIANAPVGSVVVISSKANTTRAQHWHKLDAHVCFVVSGRIEYYERPVEPDNAQALLGLIPPAMGMVAPSLKPVEQGPISRHVFTQGQAFVTDSYMEHEMYFPVATTFITLGRLSRTPEEYEKDLVRLEESLRDEWVANNTGNA